LIFYKKIVYTIEKGSDYMNDTEQKKIFAQNLKRLLDERKLNQNEVAKAINVSPQTFNTWCQEIALPRMGKIEKLANYFGVKKSDLIEPKKPQSIDDLNLTGIERIAASHRDDEFTEEDLEDIQKYIDFVKAKRKNN